MPNITFTQVNKPISFEIQASEDGDVLAFRGAILCRAETNLNRDEIDADGIMSLAKTLVGRAVDVEHDMGSNCGVFTAAKAVDSNTALSVDGFVWADRYPEQAKGIQTGTHALSVEATAETAICSVCNKVFSDADAYCEHLSARNIYGAVRKLRGLKGKGGAVTTNPAGTNTRFNPTQVYFVASHQEAGMKKEKVETKVEETKVEEAVVEAKAEEVVAEVTPEIIAEVTEVVAEKAPEGSPEEEKKESSGEEKKERDEGKGDELKAQVDEMAKCMGELRASIQTISDMIEALKVDQKAQKVTARRLALKSMSDEEFEKEKETVMGMDEKAFVLFASHQTTSKLTLAAGVRLPEPVAGGTEPLTLK